MPIDPSIILQGRMPVPIEGPLDQYARFSSMQSLLNQQRMQKVQERQAEQSLARQTRLERQETEQEKQLHAYTTLLPEAATDPETFLSEVGREAPLFLEKGHQFVNATRQTDFQQTKQIRDIFMQDIRPGLVRFGEGLTVENYPTKYRELEEQTRATAARWKTPGLVDLLHQEIPAQPDGPDQVVAISKRYRPEKVTTEWLMTYGTPEEKAETTNMLDMLAGLERGRPTFRQWMKLTPAERTEAQRHGQVGLSQPSPFGGMLTQKDLFKATEDRQKALTSLLDAFNKSHATPSDSGAKPKPMTTDEFTKRELQIWNAYWEKSGQNARPVLEWTSLPWPAQEKEVEAARMNKSLYRPWMKGSIGQAEWMSADEGGAAPTPSAPSAPPPASDQVKRLRQDIVAAKKGAMWELAKEKESELAQLMAQPTATPTAPTGQPPAAAPAATPIPGDVRSAAQEMQQAKLSGDPKRIAAAVKKYRDTLAKYKR